MGSSEPSWVSLTLQLDARGSAEPKFRWVATPSEALSLLCDESFDCLLLRYLPVWDPSGEDPIALARAVRAGGSIDPIVVVTQVADDDAWSEAMAINVDLLVTPSGWESSALIPAIERAVVRSQMQAEIDRLSADERRRLLRDRNEAEMFLSQHAQILLNQPSSTEKDGSPPDPGAAHSGAPLDPQLAEFALYYHELLRSYVMMNTGSLSAELKRLAETFRQAGVTPRRALQLHLQSLERLIEGLGSRSSRHVLTRASLLSLELLLHLAEYQAQD